MPFKIGDVVRLKSGGPKMTVVSLPSQDVSQFMCVWFAKENERSQAFFPADSLELAHQE